MTAPELKYDFLLKKDRVQSLQTANFNDAEIDWILNEAQLSLVKTRLEPSNNKRETYEMTQKRVDDLSNLHIRFPLQQPLSLLNHGGVYELPLDTLTFPYLYFLKGTVETKYSKCTITTPLKFIQSDDANEILKDPFNSSDEQEFIVYNFGRSSTSSNSSLYLYPGNLTLGKLSPEYIKVPSKISQGTYTYIDGIIYPQTTSELNPNIHNELVDLAVTIANLVLESPSYQYSQLKTLISE